MSYTNNPNMPKVRMQAVMLVKQGWSIRKTARYVGVYPSTVLRWVEKRILGNNFSIPTLSSAPHSHPNAMPEEMVRKIIEYRQRYHRCAQVLHYLLNRDGIVVSLSSVKRTLRRNNLVNHSKWKKRKDHLRSLPEPLLVETAHHLIEKLIGTDYRDVGL
ncbi:MAG: helix-turn-helix domain-containing protein [Candidatus Staskawiczbacteria bacterium]|nr:helix-turn-helix domain-containing protein [Candidatus Staskawiczbacteria bacterium]